MQAAPLSNTAIRTLWVRMAEIYGYRWTSAFGESADTGAGETWAKGLRGITGEQLANGLNACLASADPWPPTLPEFKARCFDIPPLAAVKLALRSPHKRPIFVHLVWSYIDGTAYGASNGDKADRMLRDAYELAREHVMRGGPLPGEASAAVGYEKHEYKQPPPEHVEKVLRETRAVVRAVLPAEEAEAEGSPA